MAVTDTTVLAGSSRFIVDITATANGDVTTGNVPHGLGATPLSAAIALIQNFAAAANPGWGLTTIDATNIVGTCSADAGTGVAGVQVRLEVQLPHSLTS